MKKSLFTKLFATMVLGLSSLGAWAVMPQAGKVYRIMNKAAGTAVSDRGPTGTVGCAAVNQSNNSQLWLAGDGGAENTLTFRSLGTGMYLKSSRALSSGWTLTSRTTDDAAKLVIGGNDGDYYVHAKGDGEAKAMHLDGSSNLVCWEASNPNSRWDFTVVNMSQADIEAALNQTNWVDAEVAKEATYQAILDKMFVNKQCSELNATYAAMSDEALAADADYRALAAPLQQMVLKVKNGRWNESYDNGVSWDHAHAKKYRLQSYEPFSEGSAAAQLCGIQAYTNMNNPTGILGNAGSVLYVMVEKAPADGSTLYIDGAVGSGMYNNTTSGTRLHEGLNVIPQWSDCAAQYIYYTVNSAIWLSGKVVHTEYKVTDFEPIQIHIEGGELNGYFNFMGDELYTPDTQEDFNYTSARAKHEMYDLLGQYVNLHFHLFDTPTKPGQTDLNMCLKSLLDPKKNPGAACQDLREIMKVWDELCFRERTIMGIQKDSELLEKMDLVWGYYEPLTGDDIADPGFEYGDYFNNRMMGISQQGDLYMNATSWRTAYNVNTMGAIINNITTDSGATWGPAHEYGHMNQGPMKFAGTTEESNNIFSNVVAYYFGKNTSRAAFPADQLNVFNADKTYLENDTWGTTRMFFQLWLYYHACGNNKKFYPRLYELLRQNPRQQSYYLNMRYDQCHFAKMACIAAQEDLTDFFESWGFFVPLDNYHIGDYSNFMATLTPEDAQAVKDEIKALGLPKNDQIILIDDRPGSERDSWWGWPKEQCGPLGGIKDFTDKVKPSGSLSFTLDGSRMVINHENGTAGVGFLIYDNDGTLLGFSNDYEFPLKNAAVAALMAGTAKVYAVGADGTRLELSNDFADAPLADHQANLAALVQSVADVHDVIDPQGERAGWFIEFYAKSFLAAYDAAVAAADTTNTSVTKEEITNLYLNLLAEYNALKAKDHAKVPFIANSVYQIISAQFPERVISASKTKTVNSKRQDSPKDSQLWKFVPTSAGAETYYIQNVGNSLYISAPLEDKNENGSKLLVVEKKADAGQFTLADKGFGRYALLNNGDYGYSPNVMGATPTGAICLWSSDAIGSQWYLRLIEADEKGALKAQLDQLIADGEEVLAESGTFSVIGENVELTADMLSSNAKCTNTQYGDQFTSFEVLVDNDPITFFHSNYGSGNTDDGKNHYIAIDLGAGKTLNSVQMTWMNRDTQGSNASTTNPETVKVGGSNDGKKWTTLATLTDLPSNSGAAYSSPVISDGNDYRHFRIECVKGAGDDGYGHDYFALAEIGIAGAIENIIPNPAYPGVTPELMDALRQALSVAKPIAERNASKARLQQAYDDLKPVVDALALAMGREINSIDEITADGPQGARGVYDLQGRRLAAPGRTGIYIIDGVKTLVK